MPLMLLEKGGSRAAAGVEQRRISRGEAFGAAAPGEKGSEGAVPDTIRGEPGAALQQKLSGHLASVCLSVQYSKPGIQVHFLCISAKTEVLLLGFWRWFSARCGSEILPR